MRELDVMSGKKAAFSVYKQQRQPQYQRRLVLEEDEEDMWQDGSLTDSRSSVGGTSTVTSSAADESVEGEEGGGGGGRGGVVDGGRKRKQKRGDKLLPKKRRVDTAGREREETEGSEKGTKKKKGKERKIDKAARKEGKKAAAEIVKTSKKKAMAKIGKKGKGKPLREDSEGESEEDSRSPSASDGGSSFRRFIPTRTSSKRVNVQSVDSREVTVPFFTQFHPDSYEDSRVAGRELFQLLISPLPSDDFFDKMWEQRPLLLSRHKPHYNDGWFSTKELDRILRENSVEFSTNIDITSYQDGQRYTHNPEGRAVAQVVWDFFEEGCSVRMLNPQTYSDSLWLLTSTLREHFQSFVGANVYLTPAGTQGFAPHSDDIEAFVLQLEGKKHWKLYSPRESSEILPRESSRNLSRDDLGEPIMDVILEPGDLLYFPRGTFHQAESLPDVHSLHITLSTYQKYTWGDMMTQLMSSAVERAMQEDVDWRRGLPLGCLDYTGSLNSNSNDPRRAEFIEKISDYMDKLIQYAPVDDVMDKIAASNIHSSLPPCLSEVEEAGTVEVRGSEWGDGEVISGEDKGMAFTPDTEVKLVRYNAVRLVGNTDGHMLVYNQQNSKVFQEKPMQGVPLDSNDVELAENLMQSYPDYTRIRDLMSSAEISPEVLEFFYTLYSQSIILAR